MTEGVPWGSGRTFFWADMRPSLGYAQHPYSGITANINTQYWLDIVYNGNNQWLPSVNDSNEGTSKSNPPYSDSAQGGSEITNTPVRVAASFSTLQWQGTGGTIYNGWGANPYVIGPGTLTLPPAPQTSFSNYYDGIGTCTADSPSPAPIMTGSPPESSIPSTTRSALVGLVRSLAAANGESMPDNIVAVPTMRSTANDLAFGDSITGDTGVYLVQATGRFTARAARIPSDATVPTGSALTLVVNAADLRIMDWGVQPSVLDGPALSAAGPVSYLSAS